jgi:homoserine dehydrogenase
LGYAEADPSSDVDGWDACYKLAVLTGVAFGVQLPVNMIPTVGISQISLMDLKMAKELGYQIKLVAKAECVQERWRGRVHPTLLPAGHPLAGVHGVNNALLVTGDAVGDVLFYGPGAGRMATGSAVTSDLIRICRRIQQAGTDAVKRPKDRIPEWATPEDVMKNSGQFFITIKSTTKPNLTAITATDECASRFPVDER